MEENKLKDFSGCKVQSKSTVCQDIIGKIVERTVRKAFPDDDDSTLYIVKLKGIREHVQLYEDEMIKEA